MSLVLTAPFFWATVGGSSFLARSQGSEAIMEPQQCQYGEGLLFYQFFHFLFFFF